VLFDVTSDFIIEGLHSLSLRPLKREQVIKKQMWRFYRRAAEKLQHELRLLLLCAATAKELAVSFICSSPPLICLCTLIVLTVLIWSHSSLLFFSFVLQLEIHLRILTTPTNHLFFLHSTPQLHARCLFFFCTHLILNSPLPAFLLLFSATPAFSAFFVCFGLLLSLFPHSPSSRLHKT
jgi:hypothetical protein